MSDTLLVWTPLAASVAAVHTLSGPDHYLPFIAMARAGGWSWPRTAAITALCGLGHALSSVVLALAGSVALVGAHRITGIDSLRGGIAAWALIAFGLVYAVWGLRSARRRRPHRHPHVHADGVYHDHEHDHTGAHSHVHREAGPATLTPWILFTVFVLGPCEPLIPLLMYPAVKASPWGFLYVAGLFSAVTIGCMTALVLLGLAGLKSFRLGFAERYAHAYAGLAVLACGLVVKFLGL
jgi:nickel/cobalt exporter